VSPHVDDRALWAALGTTLRESVTPAIAPGRSRDLALQWQGIAAYAAARPADPTPHRAAALRTLFAASADERLRSFVAGSDDALLAAAGRVLADDVRRSAGATAPDAVDQSLAAEILALALQWFDADVATAAPLLAVFTGHGTDPDEAPPEADPALVAALEDWLTDRVGAPVTIERATTISGGFSRLMLDVAWSYGDTAERGIVRIEQGGMFATEGRREVEIMRALKASGYPVPTVVWEEREADRLGEPFFVMERIDGAARLDDPGLDDVLRSVRDLHALGAEVVDAVAAVDGVAAGAAPEVAIEAQLRHWRTVYEASSPHPVPLLERGFAWLETHLAPTGPTVVVHGDPGPGNALHDGTGIAAVIDWEFAHAGDAAEDWSYLALIRGRRIMSPQEWKDRLARTVGVVYDEVTWNAWEAYNGVKGACVNLTALDVFTASPRPTPDHLAIGVAVHLRFLGRVVELTDARRMP
jgi:aminoglycoside phosphotransferase (APT) family kinase protein